MKAMKGFGQSTVQQFSDLHGKAVIDFHRAGGLIAMGTDRESMKIRGLTSRKG